MRTTIAHIPARWLLAFLAPVLAAGMVSGGTAQAQIMSSLKERMFGKQAQDGRAGSTPIVAHFVSERGEGFVLDESQDTPLLRFDGDDEVFQLTARPGANGDVIFKNDVGEPVLKATRLGGMILFAGSRADAGDPAAVTGKAEAFTPDHLTPAELWLHMNKSSVRVSHACNHLVAFNADEDTPGDRVINLFAEAVSVASDALVQIAGGASRRTLDRLHEVHLIEGRPPGAHVEKGVLIIKVDPEKGAWGGHPSSKRILNVMLASTDAEMRR
jgi:hypothetical protein